MRRRIAIEAGETTKQRGRKAWAVVRQGANIKVTVHRLPTYNQEDNKTNDEEGGATDGNTVGEFNQRWQQQAGPEQEVEQCPWPATRNHYRSGKLAFFVVHFL